MNPILAGSAIGAAALAVGRGAAAVIERGASFAAELAKAAGGGDARSSPPDDLSKEVKAALASRKAALQQKIEIQLLSAGVQLSESAEIVSDGQGGIAVAGPHPQQAAIQEVLASDVMLEHEFTLLAGDYDELANAIGGSDSGGALVIELSKGA
jgi:hypothetical protein